MIVSCGAASASYAVKGNVLVLSRANNNQEGPNTTAMLSALGYTVTTSATLPTDLSSYSSIWTIIAYEGFTSDEQGSLEGYVRDGGKLYLTGERPCCDSLNLTDEAILHSVLTNQAVVVGEQGDQSGPFTFNANAADKVAQVPNVLTEFPADEPGGIVGIGNISNRNVLASNGSLATGAVFDERDMTSGRGRIAISMDIDWLREASVAVRKPIVENLADFLERSPNRSRPTDTYAGLGESFAAGEGTFSYFTNAKGNPAPCYRATDGYIEQVAAATGDSLAFAACAGATIEDVVVGKRAQMLQVGPSTHLVTISLGGDDVGFSHVLADCVGGVGARGGTGCADRDEAAAQAAMAWLENGRPPGTYTLPGIKDARSKAAVESTNTVPLPSLAGVYEEVIDAAAPDAHLVVVGYPQLLETTTNPVTTCQVGTLLGVDKLNIAAFDVEWLNDRAEQLDTIIQNEVAVAAANTGGSITYVDPRPAFSGGGICDIHDGENVNPLLFNGTKVKPESFHPTQDGQNLFAQEVLGAL